MLAQYRLDAQQHPGGRRTGAAGPQSCAKQAQHWRVAAALPKPLQQPPFVVVGNVVIDDDQIEVEQKIREQFAKVVDGGNTVSLSLEKVLTLEQQGLVVRNRKDSCRRGHLHTPPSFVGKCTVFAIRLNGTEGHWTFTYWLVADVSVRCKQKLL